MISGYRQRQIFHYNKIIRILKSIVFVTSLKQHHTPFYWSRFSSTLEVQGDLTKNAAHKNDNKKFTIPWVATSYLENINLTVYDLSTAFQVRTLNSLCFTSFHNVLQMCTRDAANPPVCDVENMYLHWYSPYLGCNYPQQFRNCLRIVLIHIIFQIIPNIKKPGNLDLVSVWPIQFHTSYWSFDLQVVALAIADCHLRCEGAPIFLRSKWWIT
jgi:hypothetical protein